MFLILSVVIRSSQVSILYILLYTPLHSKTISQQKKSHRQSYSLYLGSLVMTLSHQPFHEVALQLVARRRVFDEACFCFFRRLPFTDVIRLLESVLYFRFCGLW